MQPRLLLAALVSLVPLLAKTENPPHTDLFAILTTDPAGIVFVEGATLREAWPGDTLIVPSSAGYAYVRDYYTDDVTAVNLRSGIAEKYFPVGGGGGGLLLSSNGNDLWTYSKKQVTLISTASNEILWQPETRGTIRQIAPPDTRGRVGVMTDKELVVLDPSGRAAVGKIEGLASPQMFLTIRPDAAAESTASH